jgi:hypothetical protein
MKVFRIIRQWLADKKAIICPRYRVNEQPTDDERWEVDLRTDYSENMIDYVIRARNKANRLRDVAVFAHGEEAELVVRCINQMKEGHSNE